MVLNAVRSVKVQSSDLMAIKESNLLERVQDKQWRERVNPGGEDGIFGLKLDEYASDYSHRQALTGYGGSF